MTKLDILVGDCVESMRGLRDGSVHCCITSPPYFGLRDYGHSGQIGLEETPKEFVARLVEVFREVRRVLRDDGTLWLNIGDSYATQVGSHRGRKDNQRGVGAKRAHDAGGADKGNRVPPQGVKQKELIGIPWRLAFALQDAGWYLRQDIIWHKPNPMPESVRDRCTKAHEYIFLLTKKPKYHFDAEAIKEPATGRHPGKKSHKGHDAYTNGDARHRTKGGLMKVCTTNMRNKRDVWTVAPQPFKGAHFAVFPEKLVEPCLLAGCPEGGVVLDPFAGSGTVGVVAKRHGRNAVLCELNPEYAYLARTRTASPVSRWPESIEEDKEGVGA